MSLSAQSLAPVGSCIGGFRTTFTGIAFVRCGAIMAARGAWGSDVTLRARAAKLPSALPMGNLRSEAALIAVHCSINAPVSDLACLHLARAEALPMHQPRAAHRPWLQQNQPSVRQCNWHTCCLYSSMGASHGTHGHSETSAADSSEQANACAEDSV